MVNIKGDINEHVVVSKAYFKDILTEKGTVLKLLSEYDTAPKPHSIREVGTKGVQYKKYKIVTVIKWVEEELKLGWWTTSDEKLTEKGYVHIDNVHDNSTELAALRKRIARLETTLGDVSVGYDSGGLLNLGTIKSTRQPVHRISGIYFLFKGEELVYIGQSINIMGRINNHNIDEWDSYSYTEVPRWNLTTIEQQYIHKFKPRRNARVASSTSPVIRNEFARNEL